MALQFIPLGMAHIGAAASEWIGTNGIRLPEGVDHLLFLVALALGCGSFWSTVKTATGFTLGHSVTLALAALGWVHPPARWVEGAIALSIAFLAAESLFLLDSPRRWRIAAVFGLIHGFGFASALQNLGLQRKQMLGALLGFNLGVEIGQLMILSALVPLVSEMRRDPLLRKYGLRPCSVAVFGAGTYWFIARVLG